MSSASASSSAAQQRRNRTPVVPLTGDGVTPEQQAAYAEAEQALVEARPQDAIVLLQSILAKQSKNTMCMDLLAQSHLELGQSQLAFDILKRSAAEAPTTNPQKWLWLGQLQNGQAAAQCFRQAIKMMMMERHTLGFRIEQAQKELLANGGGGGGDDDDDDKQREVAVMQREWSWHAPRQIAAAYCSMVELYTTDLCDQRDAEQQCESLLQQACELAGELDPDVWRCVCNLRLIQQRHDEARVALHKSLTLLGRLYALILDQGTSNDHDDGDVNEGLDTGGDDDGDGGGDGGGDDSDDDMDEDDGKGGGVSLIDSALTPFDASKPRKGHFPVGNGATATSTSVASIAMSSDIADDACDVELPAYDALLDLVKMSLELGEYRSAAELVEKVLADDDSAPDVWYFAGLSYMHLHQRQTARRYLERCGQKLQQQQEQYAQAQSSSADVPGPGAYVEKKVVKPKRPYSMFVSRSKRYIPGEQSQLAAATPAPGQYYSAEREQWVKQPSPFSPNRLSSMFSSQQQRFRKGEGDYHPTDHGNNLGPGSYDVKRPDEMTSPLHIVDAAPQMTQGKKNPSSVFASAEARFKPRRINTIVPGPGTYHSSQDNAFIKPSFNITIGSTA